MIGAGLALFTQGEEGLKSLVTTPPEKINISQFLDKFENSEFETVNIKDQKITAEGKNGITYTTNKELNSNINGTPCFLDKYAPIKDSPECLW